MSHRPDQAPLMLRIRDLAVNEMSSIDVVSDTLFDGRRLWALTVVDAYTREALPIDVDQGIKNEQVVEVMARISSIPRCAKDHLGGQWPGVYVEGAKPPSVLESFCTDGA